MARNSIISAVALNFRFNSLIVVIQENIGGYFRIQCTTFGILTHFAVLLQPLVPSWQGNVCSRTKSQTDICQWVIEKECYQRCEMQVPLAVKGLTRCFRRFTTRFAESCKTVMAVDFIENFVEKNRETNGHLANCRFMQADVTKLQQPINRWKY